MHKLQRGLDEVDRKVEALKKNFEKTTTEAAKLRVELEKAEETIKAAELLAGPWRARSRGARCRARRRRGVCEERPPRVARRLQQVS